MRTTVWYTLAIITFGACGGGDGDEQGNACGALMQPGALVITEMMVDPKGADAGLEWIEIYNPSGLEQCLNGVRIEVAGGSRTEQHFITANDDVLLSPGAYAVLGGDFVDGALYSFGDDLSFFNTSGTVHLKLGSGEIDSVPYGESNGLTVKEGRSFLLCGECRDSVCNDDPTRWNVAGGSPYDLLGNLGNPGTPNGDCACPAPEGIQATRKPKPGDLLITEIFANPKGADGDREWFEVLIVAQDAAIDFSGVEIVTQAGATSGTAVDPASCVIAPANDQVLFARGDAATNGGLDADYVYGTGITLANNQGYVGLLMNGEVLAGAAYTYSVEGKSAQYDITAGEWCEGSLPFGDGQGQGTPGEPNRECGVATCLLGGAAVSAQSPMPGELELTEVFPNTPGKEMPEREWLEVRVSGGREIDLNGLEFWNDPNGLKPVHTVEAQGGLCLRVQPGGIVVMARAKEESLNGLSEGVVIYVYSSLTMTTDGYLGLRYQGSLIDATEWTDAPDGRSLQKDPVSGQWCEASQQYWTAPDNKLAFGSPGIPNSTCGSTSVCRVGGSPRQVNLPKPGELVVNEIFANPAGNDSANREWLELYVSPSAVGSQLNGVEVFIKGASKGIIGEGSDQCVTVGSEFFVVGKSADTGNNGGITVDAALAGFGLPNSDVALSLAFDDLTYDFVYYDDPDDGIALQLDPDWKNRDSNDSPENWCAAQVNFNNTPELGTPGSENPPCGAEFCMENGEAKQLLKPYPDGLVITEVYANPDGADGKKEWFEVYVPPNKPAIHLNGVGIMKKAGEEPGYYFSSAVCLEMLPGQHYVLCRSEDPAENGGLDNCIGYGSIILVNEAGFLGLGKPGTIYDSVPSYGKAKDGISRSLDPEHYDAWDNDTGSNWCDTPSGKTFSDGLGTPGAMNPSCD